MRDIKNLDSEMEAFINLWGGVKEAQHTSFTDDVERMIIRFVPLSYRDYEKIVDSYVRVLFNLIVEQKGWNAPSSIRWGLMKEFEKQFDPEKSYRLGLFSEAVEF